MKKNYRRRFSPTNHNLIRVMKLTLTLLLICTTGLFASEANSQSAQVNLSMNNAKIRTVLNEIEQQTDYLFLFNPNDVDTEKQISVKATKQPVTEVLNDIFKGTSITYKKEGNNILLLKDEKTENALAKLSSVPQQDKVTVSGTVKDPLGEPIIGANIIEKGTTNGNISDFDGNFSLNVSQNAVLLISYIGYNTLEVSTAGKTVFQIVLKEDSEQLDEVVVTALGIKREEKSLGYAVQKVSGEELTKVKGVDMATSLTGKVAGLTIKNTTEFGETASIEMRGESPLIVINGVPYENISLNDIAADDIDDISTLKGATAAALYGARGSAGAIMITTKKGKDSGFSIDINSNTMFRAGWVAIPKAQTSYGHGLNGEIADDYVWGPKLDIGNTAVQWNPVSKQYEEMPLVSSGKNNFKNFLESGLITNNNVSITQTGENGYFRSSINHIYNKGQYPNQKLNKLNYALSGEMKLGDKVSIEGQMGYNYSETPQTWGGGYGNQGYIYQILMWTGPDYDLRQYRDYWLTTNEKQNWLYEAWYDNPYLIAYEKLMGVEESKLNASFTANYNILNNLKLIFRNGYDYYKSEDKVRNPAGVFSTRGPDISFNGHGWGWSGKGMYGVNQNWGQSINSDLMMTYNQSVGKFNFDVLGGGSIYYYQDKYQGARTVNGLAVPGWYSLANAIPSTAVGVDGISTIVGERSRQINSLYGKLSVSWNNLVYIDVTGRNDWSSTQPEDQRSYFYPSVSGSVILSELFNAPSWLSMWKARTSWTIAKSPLGIYDNNLPYNTSNSWGNASASLPNNLLGIDLLPSENRTWEFGTGAYFFTKRLYVDIAYFDKLYYNRQIKQTIAPSSGYNQTLINTDETYARRGFEVTLSGSPVKTKDFEWNSTINYSSQHRYYVDIDPVYSTKNQWVKPGKRMDYYAATEKALRDPQGNIIHSADGNVWLSSYKQLYGYSDPDFTFGFINSFRWRDWVLSIGIDGRIGGLMDNYVYGKMFDTGSAPETDTEYRYDEVVNGGKYIGKGVKVISGSVKYDTDGNILEDTRQYATNDIPVSYQEYMRLWGNSWEGRIHNQSFIKLRELSVMYTLPSQFLNKTFIQNASVAITGQNLFLWTKDFKYSDPDSGTEDMNAPSQRMIGCNIKVTF